MLAICGLLCDECMIYVATVEEDDGLKERLAMEYSVPGYSFRKEDMTCKGCHSEEVSKKMCGACEIRNCAQEKGHETCADCFGFPCEIYDKYMPGDAENRHRLYFLYG